MLPGRIVSCSVGVNGPVGEVEKPACGELELNVTVSGAVATCGVPPAVSSAIVIGPDGVPAAIVCGAVVNESAGAVHARNDFHDS